MREELDNIYLEDLLKPACYMDELYEADEMDIDPGCENLYSMPC